MADFHSLRGFYVSALVRSGRSIKEVQQLARHARSETTLKHYAKVAAHDLHAAVEALPDLAPPARRPAGPSRWPRPGRTADPVRRTAPTRPARSFHAWVWRPISKLLPTICPPAGTLPAGMRRVLA